MQKLQFCTSISQNPRDIDNVTTFITALLSVRQYQWPRATTNPHFKTITI